ncbi:hypothetical protein SAMN05444287_0956 [Octadecabacter temperatus]|uniref:Uncharacterized protein n=1 Tax=Octadecabacter temperatus TaxID=1458307 RepID=A0A0K0Y4H0_9RHOB|nr:hypothetical protein [Octadecabacter temperatus]AKS45854.1 hypothetical protein OSB_13000 [Octadecabacter temperatus]SIO02065.1 hypothetical protein SAMN05444287_0956 [Octadecabacter temperatus]
MTFQLTARLVVLVCAILFVIFLFAPQAYSPLYGVETNQSAQFMTRRAAPMFLAPVIVLWAASSAAHSKLREAVALGFAVMFAGVAMTGVLAWMQGTAAPMILLAAAGEVLIAALLLGTRKN